MLGSPNDLFENVPMGDRPDMSAPSPIPEAYVPAAMGTSPDGIGRLSGYGMAGELAFLEPSDASPEAAIRSAGITALAATVIGGGGLALGGAWGALSGLSASGAAFNLYRAQKWWGSSNASEKHEAVVSAIMGSIGAVVAAYTGYRAFKEREG